MIKQEDQNSSFFLMLTGFIESARYSSSRDNIYCRYGFSYGLDWSIVHGIDSGISQVSKKQPGDPRQEIVWNFPVDVTYKSTNAFGWPRLVISVYRIDYFGRDVVLGYGSLLCPTSPGRHEQYLHTYAPTSNSPWERLLNWLSGSTPEFFDFKFVAQGEGREVTRVHCEGAVKITLNVTTKGMESFGYSLG
mmetsp:Transcript_26150/g.32074  ORF Transcript_26150/g.32074 Transcript_26150/m.32074 type:complete len:191 (-) Transcript_26150:424-996(-)